MEFWGKIIWGNYSKHAKSKRGAGGIKSQKSKKSHFERSTINVAMEVRSFRIQLHLF